MLLLLLQLIFLFILLLLLLLLQRRGRQRIVIPIHRRLNRCRHVPCLPFSFRNQPRRLRRSFSCCGFDCGGGCSLRRHPIPDPWTTCLGGSVRRRRRRRRLARGHLGLLGGRLGLHGLQVGHHLHAGRQSPGMDLRHGGLCAVSAPGPVSQS